MDLTAMDFQAFDQTPNAGWRALAHAGDFAGAAQALETYLAANASLEDWQVRTLHFHAVQMHAFAGATDAALAHLPHTFVPDEAPDTPIRWNDYVRATDAFLRGDRDRLVAAREAIAQGPKRDDGSVPNLAVVDRLLAGFGKPYGDAY